MEKENKKIEDETKEIPVEEVVIDDTEDENETLDKNIEKENIFENETREKKKALKISIIQKTKKCAVIMGCVLAALVLITLAVRLFLFKKDDDKFLVDNPEDPLSYSNVASSVENNTIIPIFRFNLFGKYSGITENDATKMYLFDFDETGYFEGYSSFSEDDFGAWDIVSDGDDFYVKISCTEAEDKYRVEILDNGYITLVGRDNTFTLAPYTE